MAGRQGGMQAHMAMVNGKSMYRAFPSRRHIPSTVPTARGAVVVTGDIVLAFVNCTT